MELAQMVLAALAGGGLWGLVTWRLRKRQLRGDVATKQYRQMEEIIDSYISKMTELGDKIVKLQRENINLRQEILAQHKTQKEHGTTDQD